MPAIIVNTLYKKNPKDYAGQRHGSFTVLDFNYQLPGAVAPTWLARCDCGNERFLSPGELWRGRSSDSCICHHHARRPVPPKDAPHRVRILGIWRTMKRRCENSQDKNYRFYGARGITVCPEWSEDGRAFYDWSIANGYVPGLEIDRTDNQKGYSPDNCRWVPWWVNRFNQRSDQDRRQAAGEPEKRIRNPYRRKIAAKLFLERNLRRVGWKT